MVKRILPETRQSIGIGMHQFCGRSIFPITEMDFLDAFIACNGNGIALTDCFGEVRAPREGRSDDLLPFDGAILYGLPHLHPAGPGERMIGAAAIAAAVNGFAVSEQIDLCWHRLFRKLLAGYLRFGESRHAVVQVASQAQQR